MKNFTGIDYRSLTLFRQAVALLFILFAFVLRIGYFDFYSVEHGPFSNEVIQQVMNKPFLLNIIQTDVQLFLFLLIGLVLGLFIFLGVYTSASSFFAIVYYIWLTRRFIPYYYGTDEFMVSILFSLFFVYLLNPKDNNEDNYIGMSANPFVLLLLVQIAIVYFFNGINKTSLYWWSGEAVSMTSFNVLLNKPFAIQFVGVRWISVLFSYLTLAFEIGFPFLVFSTYKSKYLRVLAGILLLLFHWGIHMFADVTFYRFLGTALFILFLPSEFWDRFPRLSWLLVDKNKRFNLLKYFPKKYYQYPAVLLVSLVFFKAASASICRQNERYDFIKNEFLMKALESTKSRTYSPLRQYWFMFAPSPPINSGYIACDYMGGKTPVNINIYGNNMPEKDFPFYHPQHLATIIQFGRVAKGLFESESQFILTNLFLHEIKKDLKLHPERAEGDYQLVLYQQSYSDYLKTKVYSFERIVLASFD